MLVVKGRVATYPFSLEKSLRESLLARPGPKEKKAPYHNTQEILERDLGDIESIVKEYLNVKPSQRILWGKTIIQFVPSPPVKFQPSFSDAVKGKVNSNFYKKVAAKIDNFEVKLTSAAEEDFLDVGPQFIDLPKFAEHVAWLKIVRLLITAALIKSLDYERMWKDNDGDAGWWLSERVEKLAGNVLELDEFKKLEKELQDKDTFLSSLGLSVKEQVHYKLLPYHFLTGKLPIREQLQKAAHDATVWRNWCHLIKGCSAADIGNHHPWIFETMDRSLFTPTGQLPTAVLLPTGVPPHMHARKAAEQRAKKVKEFWEELIKMKVVSEEFKFVVTAGTLKHGGAHPPHKTHRDGSMFDMDLTNLPDLISLFAEDEEPKFGTTARLKIPQETPEDEEEGVFVQLSGPLTEQLLEFASDEKQEEFRKIAKKFTQCIYLTFPASVIYGSKSILQKEARDELMNIVNKLISATSDENKIKKLEIVKSLILRKELLKPIIKADHRDHWHVNYNPDYLGDEGEIIKSAEPELANTIKAALQALDEDDLWKELLEE